MGVYKDKQRKTWMIKDRYKDWKGQECYLTRRGFETKHQAQEKEISLLAIYKGSIACTFKDFSERYFQDVQPRVKQTTMENKKAIFNRWLIPYFGKFRMNEITAKQINCWQNELLTYVNPDTQKPLSKTYIRNLHNQMCAIFHHACRFYSLSSNPASIAGNISEEKREMLFWTLEEYQKFAAAIEYDRLAFCIFETLYWTGIRECELLALTWEDVDLEKRTLRINKGYHRMKGKDVITSPKTAKSNRTIALPDFLCKELQELHDTQMAVTETDRMFPVSQHYLYHVMDEGCRQSGVKRIRVHDCRHSHVSLLIHLGFTAVAIADRMGHESQNITFRYAHMFPSVQESMVQKLELVQKEAA